ncbi:MAG: glycosyl transferase family 1 [Bacteroidia bacterium]|nr:MAG: glycosyl transferase family 1 [Bacteroidia bacterium]
MKVLHISYSKDRGGAAKACLRLHRALLKNNVNSQIITALRPKTKGEKVESYCKSDISQIIRKTKKIINLLTVMIFQKTDNQELHTFDFGNIISPDFINNSDADIVHLHWVNYSMLGIKTIKKIKKPMIWTFHDMWAFMGCEHLDNLNSPERYIEGYNKKNKNVKGIDINKIAWKAKKKHWKDVKFNIVTPSKWLKKCTENSYLFKDANIFNIPNVIAEDKFYNKKKADARKNLMLAADKNYILFGAFNAKNHNKGGDLLYEALKNVKLENTELVIFGASSSDEKYNIPTKYMGYIRDEGKLNDLYNAADVFVVPSRQDNLPNTVLESICCGTPVVGFNIGGLPDMIVHKHNGYLSQPFDTNDLRAGIEFILRNKNNIDFTKNSIKHFKSKFSEEVVIPQFLALYDKVACKKTR